MVVARATAAHGFQGCREQSPSIPFCSKARVRGWEGVSGGTQVSAAWGPSPNTVGTQCDIHLLCNQGKELGDRPLPQRSWSPSPCQAPALSSVTRHELLFSGCSNEAQRLVTSSVEPCSSQLWRLTVVTGGWPQGLAPWCLGHCLLSVSTQSAARVPVSSFLMWTLSSWVRVL